jgi:8-oxo-dGTP pyrophosphatase MutT (NUDIX family)
MRKIKRDIVSALIFSKDEKLFMGRKDKNKGGVYSDCWHIPGGGVDKGEDFLTALLREVIEETGMDISPYKIELIDDKKSGVSEKILKNTGEKVLCEMKFSVYKVSINDKNADEIKIKLDDDLVEFNWFSGAELKKIRLTPPSVELFTELGFL